MPWTIKKIHTHAEIAECLHLTTAAAVLPKNPFLFLQVNTWSGVVMTMMMAQFLWTWIDEPGQSWAISNQAPDPHAHKLPAIVVLNYLYDHCRVVFYSIYILGEMLLRFMLLYSFPLQAISFYSTPFHSTPLNSLPLHSTFFYSTPFHFFPLHSIPFQNLKL